MDINVTLFGEMITFAVFIWFTMKFVWPPLMKVMEERREKIADGLAAGEQGRHDLELAQYQVQEQLTEAKAQAALILEQAQRRANHIVEEAKGKAREEGERLIVLAKDDIEKEYNTAKEQLMQQVSDIAVAGAEKILQKEIDAAANSDLVNQLVSEIR